ncbi:MAG: Fic family protein [Planctomycetes bacterium]|nr:Fic family protein [Planctomycetota bacterium]
MDPYIPEKLPLDLSALNWQTVTAKVSKASAALAYYNGILESIINPAIFLSPLETKEAVLSSRIEGTITTVDEVLKYEVDLKPESIHKQNDIIEVLNYRKATRSAKEWLKRDLPFNLTLICAIQNELIQGARGKDKHPGEIRKEQVWIGARTRPIEEASYVPPEPLGLKVHLNKLIDYMNRVDQEVLIQTAIMHAQFEIIHPFCDGNGRTGRILIPLFLWYKERISSPMFYISEYFDENRDQYVENLRKISDTKDWEHWILFFLEAISIQAKRNSEKANQVLNLYNLMRGRISELTKSPKASQVLDALFITPVIRTPNFIELTGLKPSTAHRIIALLKEKKILSSLVQPSGRTPEVLVFDDLFKLIR